MPLQSFDVPLQYVFEPPIRCGLEHSLTYKNRLLAPLIACLPVKLIVSLNYLFFFSLSLSLSLYFSAGNYLKRFTKSHRKLNSNAKLRFISIFNGFILSRIIWKLSECTIIEVFGIDFAIDRNTIKEMVRLICKCKNRNLLRAALMLDRIRCLNKILWFFYGTVHFL